MLEGVAPYASSVSSDASSVPSQGSGVAQLSTGAAVLAAAYAYRTAGSSIGVRTMRRSRQRCACTCIRELSTASA
eukprot:3936640-Rhodomonas_salina.1